MSATSQIMEKPIRSKRSNFKTFLTQSASFSNPAPLMPSHHSGGYSGPIHRNRGYSGPIHLVPSEARREEKTDISLEMREPTSPMVSCIGQIKQKSKKNKLPRSKSIKKHILPPKPEKNPISKKNSFVQRMFGGKPSSRRRLDVSRSDNALLSKAPTIDHMRRFKSGRESLRDFDWRAVEREVKGMDSKEDDVSGYYSALLVLGAGVVVPKPKKEVNLWKRRTLGELVPLKLEEI